MSRNPSDLDGGVYVRDRVWPLHDPTRAHVAEDFYVPDSTGTLVLSLRQCDIGNLTSYDQFKHKNATVSDAEGLLHLIFRALQEARTDYLNDVDKERLTTKDLPLQVFLECVLANDENQPHRQREYDARREALALDQNCTREELEAQLRDYARRRRGERPPTQFMAGYEGREVVEYRLWIVTTDKSIAFTTYIDKAITYARARVTELQCGTSFDKDKSGIRSRHERASTGQSGAEDSMALISSLAQPDERWIVVVSSLEKWCNVLAGYTRMAAFDSEQSRLKAMSAFNIGSSADNMLSPQNAFGIGIYFDKARKRDDADKSQLELLNYFKPMGGSAINSMTFPHPKLVVPVPSEFWSVKRFRRLYTPDYQARVVQERLSLKHFPNKLPMYEAEGPDDPGDGDGDGDDGSESSDSFGEPLGASSASSAARAARGARNNDADPLAEQRRRTFMELKVRPVRVHARAALTLICCAQNRFGFARCDEVVRKLGNAHGSAWGRPHDDASVARQSTFEHGTLETRRRETEVQSAREGGVVGNETALTCKHKDAVQCATERARIEDAHLRALAYTLDQDTATLDFVATCTDETARVSESMRGVNAYTQARIDNKTAHFRHAPKKIFDARLSTFGTMMARRAYQLEEHYEVLQMHRELLTFEVAVMDTTRHEHDLHWHVWCTGPASVGKSFCAELIERQAIPGTVAKIDKQTKNSNATEDDKDDVLLIYGELPQELVCWAKGGLGDAAAHEMFKERLSSCRQNTQTFYYRTINGQDVRSSKMCTSSQLGCVIGLTNMSMDDMAAAMLERGVKCEVAVTTREDRGFHDVNTQLRARIACMAAQSGIEDSRLMQAIHIYVWKQIYTGPLTEVSTPVLALYLPKLDHVLRTQFGVQMSSRDVARIRILVKNLVIREAITRQYQHRASKLCDADFSHDQIRNLDPWLKDHQELVLWAFSFMMDQFIRPNRTALMLAMRAFRTDSLTNVDRFMSIEGHARKFTSTALTFGGHDKRSHGFDKRARERLRNDEAARVQQHPYETHADRAAQVAREQQRESTLQMHTQTESGEQKRAAERARWRVTPNRMKLVPMGGSQAADFDFNYVVFKGRPRELAGELASEMVATGSGGARSLNSEQVRDEWRALANVEIRSKPYVQNEQYGAEGAEGKYPVRLDESGRVRPFRAVRIEERTQAIFVFSGLLFSELRDPFEAVVDECLDEYTVAATFLAGTTYKPTTPHLFGTYEVGPRQGKRLHFCMPSSVDDGIATALYGDEHLALRKADAARRDSPPWMRSKSFMLLESVNHFATRYRLHTISLPHNSAALVALYSPTGTDRSVRKRGTSTCQLVAPEDAWRYPDDAERSLPAQQEADNYFSMLRNRSDDELLRDPETRKRVTRGPELDTAEERQRFVATGDPRLLAIYEGNVECNAAQAAARKTAHRKRSAELQEAAEASAALESAKRARLAEPEADDVDGDDDSHERRAADIAQIDRDLAEEEAANAPRISVAEAFAAAREMTQQQHDELVQLSEAITTEGGYSEVDLDYQLNN